MTHRAWKPRMPRAVRRIAFVVLQAVDGVLQLVLPVRRNRVCYVSIPDYTDSAFAMYRHLLRTRRGLEHVWLVDDLAIEGRIRREFADYDDRGHRLIVRPWSPGSYPAFLRSRYIFHTHGVYGFSRPRFRRDSICVWHGMPVKAIRRLHTGDGRLFPVHGTVHVASSSFFRYVIAGVFDAHPADVLVSGLPRTDVLKGKTDPVHDRRAIAAALGLDPDRKWLLWMPTHRSEQNPAVAAPKRSFVEVVSEPLMDALDAACAEQGVEVIIKLHPFDVLNERSVDLGRPALKLLTQPAWAATEIQLYDLVAAADGLITDISSVFIDYLHTGNPIGIIGFEADTYTRETLFDHRLLLECGAAVLLDEPNDVERFVSTLTGGGAGTGTGSDLAVVFNEDGDIVSAEAVALAVGL